MGNIIPFFHYDLLARVVPGALTLGVLAYAGVELPQRWVPFFSADTAWAAVVIPLALAGGSYAIGVLYEVLFALRWPWRRLEWLEPGRYSERLADVGFDDAFRHEHNITCGWRHPATLRSLVRALKKDGIRKDQRLEGLNRGGQWLKSLKKIRADLWNATRKDNGIIKNPGELKSCIRECERELRFALWNGLLHAGIADKARLFAHIVRFQAEARMCLHGVAPMALFCGYALWDCLGYGCTQQRWEVIIGFLFLVLLGWGAYARERRRWLQVLIAARYMLRAAQATSLDAPFRCGPRIGASGPHATIG